MGWLHNAARKIWVQNFWKASSQNFEDSAPLSPSLLCLAEMMRFLTYGRTSFLLEALESFLCLNVGLFSFTVLDSQWAFWPANLCPSIWSNHFPDGFSLFGVSNLFQELQWFGCQHCKLSDYGLHYGVSWLGPSLGLVRLSIESSSNKPAVSGSRAGEGHQGWQYSGCKLPLMLSFIHCADDPKPGSFHGAFSRQ